jgi:archaemetzincin
MFWCVKGMLSGQSRWMRIVGWFSGSACVGAVVLGCLKGIDQKIMVHDSVASVCVKPVGQVDAKVVDNLAWDLAAALGIPCATSSAIPIPERSLDPTRHQYLATEVMAAGRPSAPTEVLLLVTDQDLFVPRLNFVFGVGDPRTRVAIISLLRLRQETYGLPSDQKLFRRRTLTEAVHELGHVFGLGHCDNRNCVMTFSNNLDDTDRKGPDFCPSCRSALDKALSAFARRGGAG